MFLNLLQAHLCFVKSSFSKNLLNQFNQNPLPSFFLIGFLIRSHPPGDVWSPWPVCREDPVRAVWPDSPWSLTLPLGNCPSTDPTLRLGYKSPFAHSELGPISLPTVKAHCGSYTFFDITIRSGYQLLQCHWIFCSSILPA